MFARASKITDSSGTPDISYQLKLNDLAGLWIILGITIGE